MIIKKQNDGISLFSFLDETANYGMRTFRHDLISALTVALLALPQSIAYALVANLPPSVGLFAAIFGTIFGAGFGSSRHLVMGPTNAIAILIQSGVSEILYSQYREVIGPERNIIAIYILTQLTFVTGILQILAGSFKVGRLTQFVSRSVVVGYILGAACFVVVSQLGYFLGLPRRVGMYALYEQAYDLLINVHSFHVPTALVGTGSLVLLLYLQRKRSRLPNSVIMLTVMGGLVYFFGLSPLGVSGIFDQGPGEELQKVALIRDFGDIHIVKPTIMMPFFDLRIMREILPIAFVVALLGVLEATSISKTMAAKTGRGFSVNQEILGLGMGNFFSSFFGAMPSSGSPSRTVLNFASGGETRFSAMMSGLFVAGILVILGPLVTHIPLASLAALLLVTAVEMVDVKQLKLCLRATRSDAAVMTVTAASCFIFTLDIAFYIGIVLSIVLYLKEASSPFLVEFAYDGEGRLVSEEKVEAFHSSPIRVINVEGELFFGAADIFQAALRSVAENRQVKVIILHVKNAHHIDATACWTLEQFQDYLAKTGRHLIASGLRRQVWDALCHSGLTKKLKRENLFLYDPADTKRSSSQALIQACKLLEKER
ncbi:MAG: SulP family sulfate permease [Chlamydiales bacterium]|jgi:SulP family sulfate permease